MSHTSLADGTRIHCLRRSEALVLDQHVAGYFEHGVTLRDGDVVMDVGANIGVFAVRALQRFPRVRVVALVRAAHDGARGLLTEAVEVASAFLDGGTVVSYDKRGEPCALHVKAGDVRG